jgi:hypothetical protein
MSKELCEAIINYIRDKSNSDEDLNNTGREVVATHKYGLLTDEERDRIFAAGRKKREEIHRAQNP